MRRVSYFVVIVIVALATAIPISFCAAAPSPAPIRVALLATSADPRVAAIRELAEAQLAQGDQLQLLERQGIERVLAEHHLQLTGLVDAEHAVNVGKILSADLLAVVESDAKSQGAAFVIFDPATGVRLWDAGLAIEDAAKAGDSLAAAIRDAAGKRKNTAVLHTICLMTVRNADLPRDMDGFCDAVGRLLERNLVGSSSVALLERGRLDQVSKERAIAPGGEGAGRDLLASLVTVELEVSRGSDGHGLRAAAFLSDSEARSLAKVTAACKQDDAVALAAGLAAQFAAKLKVPPGASGDRAIEAARFFREAQLRIINSDYPHALVAAEAAHALAPENAVCHAALARAVVFNALPPPRDGPVSGVWVTGTATPSSLLRGAEMTADVLPLTTQIPPLPASVARGQLNDAVNIMRYYVSVKRSQAADPKLMRALPQGLDAMNAPLRRYFLKEDEIVRATAKPVDLPLHLITLVYDLEFICSRDSTQWSEDLVHCIDQWLALHAVHPSNDIYSDMRALDALVPSHYSYFTHRIERRWEMLAADYERFTAVQKRMQGEADPLISGYGDLLALSLAVARAQNAPQQIRQEVDAFVAEKKRLLTQPGTHDRPDTLRLLYHLICIADRFLDGTDDAGRNSIELLDLALSRREIESFVLTQGIFGGVFKTPLTHAESVRRIAVIERAMQVAHAPGTLFLTRWDDEAQYRVALEKARHPQNTDAGYATTRPWAGEKQLVNSLETDDIQNLSSPIVVGESVYLIGAIAHNSGDTFSAQLLSVPLAGGPVQRYGSLPTTLIYTKLAPQYRLLQKTALVVGSCFADGKYCVATRNQGLMIFPTDGSPAEKLDEKSGLPTTWGQSIALLDGRIYAGLGKAGSESYLIACDLNGGHVNVLASNARRDRSSPFDDAAAFKMKGLIADPPRHRLIAIVERYEATQQVNGIWEYKPATGQWKQLLPIRLKIPADTSGFSSGFFESIQSFGAVRNERFPVVTNTTYFLFDLRSDSALAVLQPTQVPDPALPRDTPNMEGVTDAGRHALATHWAPFIGIATFDPPWVWSTIYGRFPWNRCNYMTGQHEYFATLRPDVPYPFVPRFLQSVGDGSRIIVGDECGLWLLTLGNRETQEKH